MNDATAVLHKAQLIELNRRFDEPSASGGAGDGKFKRMDVQFNPETLKLGYSNQIGQDKGADQGSGNPGLQFTGTGLTKLSLQLWFDVTAAPAEVGDDVRRLTRNLVYFVTPYKSDDSPPRLLPPAVRFSWGSFLFDGVVESLDETLEHFSPAGLPLRASVGLTMLQQKILELPFESLPPLLLARPGQAPLSTARAGDSLQTMAARAGLPNWQAIAAANGIEDPLRMVPGRLVDLQAGARSSTLTLRR